jgi:group I intron endonuclease
MPNENTWYVYIHINKINGKRYIGITSRIPEKRWGKNGIGYKRHPYFWNAIQKYGWDNFLHIIVLQEETLEYACKVEKCLIKHYKSNDSEYGYNYTLGGEGKCLTQEQKRILSEQMLGEKNPFYGKHHTEETKERLRKISKNQILSEKQIECLKLGRGKWTHDRRIKLSNSHKGERSPTSKLKENDVIEILNMIQQHKTYSEIRDIYNISNATISSIKHKQRWGYLYEKYPELYEGW